MSAALTPEPMTNVPNNSLNNNNIDDQLARDVLKAGWLRFIPFAEKPSRAPDDYRFWVVFLVLKQTDPYLEFYSKRQLLPHLSTDPVSIHSLKRCRHIAPAIAVNDQCANEFAISLDTHVIRLVADSQHSMTEWCLAIKTKLRQLNVLTPKDNLYTYGPQMPDRRNNNTPHSVLRPLPPLPVPNNNPILSQLVPQPTTSSLNEDSARASSPQELYEAIFTDRQSPAARPPSISPVNGDIPLEEGPPPYESIAEAHQSSPVSLRESQVLKLRREIGHPSGVRLMVRKKDLDHSLALVDIPRSTSRDYGEDVWIAGWKQKDFPVLHNTFHIGDQILSINGIPVENSRRANKIIKEGRGLVEIIVRRVPLGRVLCIKRQTEGQDLGLVRDGGTARIIDVVSGGLTDKAGLPKHCQFGGQTCDWCLTEVNNRALNLFYKSNEIEMRLNAVGKEISILVQPLDYVLRLRKGLKQLKSYKDYIVQ